ncbi:MAG: hypothetical protein ABR577_02185 [Pyrinomonadaceae bacterium]
MISRTWSQKSVALCLAVAILSLSSMVALAAPGQQGQTGPSGELTASGQVAVNGQNAISGATVFSDSTITTGENSSATISLGKMGRVELLPKSSMKLSFNATGITGTLEAGRTRVSTPQGVSANLMTKDGAVVADGTQASVFSIDVECGNTILATQGGQVTLRAGDKTQQVAAGQDATAGTAQPGTRCSRLAQNNGGGFGALSGGALAALLAAAGGAIAAAIIAARSDNNDANFGGSIQVISPTR